MACSLLDYPLRRLSGGRVASATREVPSSAMSYDAAIASELWDEAGKVAGVRGGYLMSSIQKKFTGQMKGDAIKC